MPILPVGSTISINNNTLFVSDVNKTFATELNLIGSINKNSVLIESMKSKIKLFSFHCKYCKCFCEHPLSLYTSRLKKGRKEFACCMEHENLWRKEQPRLTLSTRFWSKVKIIKDKTSCWEWTACKNRLGYGNFGYMGKLQRSNRVAYHLLFGDFDKTLKILHRCDNPLCVRPSHLFLGTSKDNTQDMLKKGRFKVPKHHIKVTQEVIAEIKQLKNENPTFTNPQIAKLFNISPESVRLVLKGLGRHKNGHIT